MSIHNQILESVQSDRWRLAGLVTASPHLGQAGNSLKLIRDSDALGPSIRSAMNAEAIIPVVEISTPSGMATLGNVRIVNIALPARPLLLEVASFSFGASRGEAYPVGSGQGASEGRVNIGGILVPKTPRRLRKGSEFLEIALTFHSITISPKKGKGLTDDWSIPA